MSVAGKGLFVSRGDLPVVDPKNPGMLYFQESNRVDDGACHKTAAHTVNLETRNRGERSAHEKRGERYSLSLSLSLSLSRTA